MKPSLRIGPQAPGPAPLQRRLINRPARKRVGCVGHPTRPRRLPPNGPDSRVARPAAGSPVDGRPLPGTSTGRCPASTTCARRERIRQPTFGPRAQRQHAVGWQGSPSSQAQRQGRAPGPIPPRRSRCPPHVRRGGIEGAGASPAGSHRQQMCRLCWVEVLGLKNPCGHFCLRLLRVHGGRAFATLCLLLSAAEARHADVVETQLVGQRLGTCKLQRCL